MLPVCSYNIHVKGTATTPAADNIKWNEMERRCDEMHQHALMCRTVVFVFCLALLFMMMTMMMLCLISSNDLRLYSLDVLSSHATFYTHYCRMHTQFYTQNYIEATWDWNQNLYNEVLFIVLVVVHQNVVGFSPFRFSFIRSLLPSLSLFLSVSLTFSHRNRTTTQIIVNMCWVWCFKTNKFSSVIAG